MSTPEYLPSPEPEEELLDLPETDRELLLMLLEGYLKRVKPSEALDYMVRERDLPPDRLAEQGVDYAVTAIMYEPTDSEPASYGFLASRTARKLIQVEEGGPFIAVEGEETKVLTLADWDSLLGLDMGIVLTTDADADYGVPDGGLYMTLAPELTAPEVHAIMRALQTDMTSGKITE